MYKRCLNLVDLINHKSLFLLGPRQTGKSTLLRTLFKEKLYIDLLESDTFRELSAYPEKLRQRIRPTDDIIIIDEVQKLPIILDEVQLIIDRNPNIHFILTGSSARKLKRGKANLLGGRAWFKTLHSLCFAEIGIDRINEIINYGSLPGIIDSPYVYEDLLNYVGVYLKEEIQAESLTRSISNFSRFLNFAALSNAKQINYSKMANDAQIPPRTLRDYFSILEDTLLAYQLPPYRSTVKRKAVATAKFYFFDLGVAHALQGRNKIVKHTPEYGLALEHLVFLELKAYLDYKNYNPPLYYFRSQTKLEVDFVIPELLALEVKSNTHISVKDGRSIMALSEEVSFKRKIIVSNESKWRMMDQDNIEIFPVKEFFKQLWADKILVFT